MNTRVKTPHADFPSVRLTLRGVEVDVLTCGGDPFLVRPVAWADACDWQSIPYHSPLREEARAALAEAERSPAAFAESGPALQSFINADHVPAVTPPASDPRTDAVVGCYARDVAATLGGGA